jgi:DNA-binding response OmpR family regulator
MNKFGGIWLMTLRRPRILFVDDHEDTRDLVTLLLKSQYDVATASSIQESLKLISSANFNLFIFDSWLLDGSGIDLCKQVREFDQGTPILFYSAAAYETDKNSALEAGAQAYLVKPVEVSDLLDAIGSLMPKRRKIRVRFERERVRGTSTLSNCSAGQTTLV